MTKEASERLEGVVTKGVLAALLLLIGAVGSTSLQGQTTQPPPQGPTTDRLEERLDGRHELVMSRLSDVVSGQNAQVAAVAAIAEGVGEIKGAVDKVVLNQAALSSQMAARVEADRLQDAAISELRRAVADMQRLLEERQ